MQSDKIVDNTFLQRYIWIQFLNKIKESGQTISSIADKLGYSQPYLSRVLNWKDTTLKKAKIEEIAYWIGFSKKELDNIIKQAKKEEYKEQFWEEIIINSNKTNEDINLKVALNREYWIKDNEAIEDIENFIKYIKLKYNDSPKK